MKALYLFATLALIAAAAPGRAANVTPETPEERAMLQEVEKQDHAGAAMLERGEYAIAELDFRRAITVWPDDARAYQGLAEALTGLGHREDAIQTYRSLIYSQHFVSSTAGEVRTLAGYAILLNQTGQWNEAVQMYRRALPSQGGGELPKVNVQFTPNDPQPILFAAAANIMYGFSVNGSLNTSGNPEKDRAQIYYEKALKLEPNWDLANFYYVYGLMNTNHPKEAERACNRLLDLNPNKQIRAVLKNLYGVVGKIDLATGKQVITK